MTEAASNEFPCQSCGGLMAYDAAAHAMKCPYCSAVVAVAAQPGTAEYERIPLQEGLARAPRGWDADVRNVSCNECGASVQVGAAEQTTKCPFCGSSKVLDHPADPNIIRPGGVVPFAIDRAQANQRFDRWIKGLWFRPNDLAKMAKVQEMGGVYLPFWAFSADVASNWRAEAGYYYYETETYRATENGRQVTKTRRVQHTRWQPAWGARRDRYDDLLICASKGVPADLTNKVSKFDMKQVAPYQAQFLAGWRAEAYAVGLEQGWGTATQRIEAEQRARCARDVPGDTHRGLVVHNQISGVTFQHVLLPIWLAAYRYNGKVYQLLVNGQTGEVVGKAPWSVWKILALVAAILAIVIAIAVASNRSHAASTTTTTIAPTHTGVVHAAPPATAPATPPAQHTPPAPPKPKHP